MLNNMKKLQNGCLFLLALLCFSNVGKAQVVLQNAGAKLTISGAGVVTIQGNLENQGELSNDGEIYLSGDWVDDGQHLPAQGLVVLNGTSDQQVIKTSLGPEEFYMLNVDKSAGEAKVQDAVVIGHQLQMLNGHILLENGPLSMDKDASILGASATRYVKAHLGHNLKMEVEQTDHNSTIYFPVGDDGAYTPAELLFIAGDVTTPAYIGCHVDDQGDPAILSGSSNYIDQQWIFGSNNIDLETVPLVFDADCEYAASGDEVGTPPNVIEIPLGLSSSVNTGGSLDFTNDMVEAVAVSPTVSEVAITAGDQCSFPVTLSIDHPVDAYCPGDAPPTITPHFAGDDQSSNFSFNWSNGQTSMLATVSASGIYTVTVTDVSSGSCKGFASIELQANLASNQLIEPIAYYTFDQLSIDGNPISALASSVDQDHELLPTGTSSIVQPTDPLGGDQQVGNFLQKFDNTCSFEMPPTKEEVSFEMIFRLPNDWDGVQMNILTGAGQNGPVSIELAAYFLNFRIYLTDEFGVTTSFLKYIFLDGTGLNGIDYWADNEWHHLVVTVDAPNGTSNFYLDGQRIPELSHQVGFSSGAELSQYVHGGGEAVQRLGLKGYVDEIAVYDQVIPPTLVYQHFKDAIDPGGNHYNFTDETTPCDQPAQVPSANVIKWDYKEFPIGFDETVECDLPDPVDQIKSFPAPRYQPGHQLLPNFPWYDHTYLAGQGRGRSCPTIFDRVSKEANFHKLQVDLASHWNQYVTQNGMVAELGLLNPDGTGENFGAREFVKVANEHPELPRALITLWTQTKPNILDPALDDTPFIMRGTLDEKYYEWVDQTSGSTPIERIHPASYGYEDMSIDGKAQNRSIQYFSQVLNGSFDHINENGEVGNPKIRTGSTNPFVLGTNTSDNYLISQSAGQSDYLVWTSQMRYEFRKVYRDELMANMPGNPRFSWFALDGTDGHQKVKYSETFEIQANYPNGNANYYSTPDFYPRNPYNWSVYSLGSMHGLKWITEGRSVELDVVGSDHSLFSPFVSAGWGTNYAQYRQLRPSQYLSLLKVLAVYGAEFYYIGYFNETKTLPGVTDLSEIEQKSFMHPGLWSWQAVMPSYAQAITSRRVFEDILLNGSLIQSGGEPVFRHAAGGFLNMVAVRKHNTDSKYILTGSKQVVGNSMCDIDETHKADIDLEGQALTFDIRRQGSTYFYDKSNSSEVVFYQLDGWHDYGHPDHWSKSFEFEAELYDEQAGGSAWTTRTRIVDNAGIEAPADVSNANDFSNYVTYLTFDGTGTAPTTFHPLTGPRVDYTFKSPEGSSSFDLYFRARANSQLPNTATTGLYVSIYDVEAGVQVYADFIPCVDRDQGGNWHWYSTAWCKSGITQYNFSESKYYELRIVPANEYLELDKFRLHNVPDALPSYINNVQSQTCTGDPDIRADFYILETCSAVAELHAELSVLEGCGSNDITLKWYVDGSHELQYNDMLHPAITLPSFGTAHSITLEVLKGGSVEETVIHPITIYSPPTAMSVATISPICPGEQVGLSASFAAGSALSSSFTYSWETASRVDVPTAQSVTASPTFSEDFVVTVKDGNNCTAEQTHSVTVAPCTNALSVSITNSCSTVVCPGASALNCVLQATAVNGSPTYSYAWYENGVLVPACTTAACSVSVTDFSKYWTVEVVDAANATASASSGMMVSCKTGDNENPEADELGAVVDEDRIALFAFPNPFREEVNLVYYLPEDATVELSVINAMGTTLIQQEAQFQTAGQHQLQLNHSSIRSAGVYFVRLRVNDEVISQRIIAQ